MDRRQIGCPCFPRGWTFGCSLIALRLRPFPVTKDTLAQSSRYRLKARTKTSLSGEWTWISIASSDVASAAWRNIFVSASWLRCRFWTSLCVALHSLPEAATNRLPPCLLNLWSCSRQHPELLASFLLWLCNDTDTIIFFNCGNKMLG